MTSLSETSSALLKMEDCTADDQLSQQFWFRNVDGKVTIHLKSNPDLCVGIGDSRIAGASAILKTCSEKHASHHIFAATYASGGGLQLVGTSLCLNLLDGDIKAGSLGYFDCALDLNEVFVYSQGNPTVAGLLHRMHETTEWMQSSGVTSSVQLSAMPMMLLLGVCFPALWLVRSSSLTRKAEHSGSASIDQYYLQA
jgi:hypothetical protein